jgi:hypothetical protein
MSAAMPRRDLRIGTDRRPCGSPPVSDIDGRAVVWLGWSPIAGHGPKHLHRCIWCGHHGIQWITWGRVDPVPGATVLEPRPTRREPDRLVAVPAYPVLSLVAYQCPACHRIRMFHGLDPTAAELHLQLTLDLTN